MNGFIEWCIVASMVAGYFNLAFLVIIDNKLNEIKREILKLKKEKREMRSNEKTDTDYR